MQFMQAVSISQPTALDCTCPILLTLERPCVQGLATAMTQLPLQQHRSQALSLLRTLLALLAPEPRSPGSGIAGLGTRKKTMDD